MAAKKRPKGSQEEAQGQPRKGTRAAKKRHKDRLEARKGTRAGMTKHKGKQE